MKSHQLQLFKIRDLRQKTQFKVDDNYLNGYARVCKPVATAVYNSLCRHAEFHTQKAFPSQKKIAFEHNISVEAVKRGVKKLLNYRIIAIERERKRGKFSSYIYFLLDKSEWKKLTRGQKEVLVTPEVKNQYWLTRTGKQGTKDNKEQRITNTKDTKKKKNDSSFYKKKPKPYYYDLEMRKVKDVWFVLPADGSPWLKYAGLEKDIDWR